MRKNCNNACKLVEFLADTERILTYFSESIISDNYSGLYNELGLSELSQIKLENAKKSIRVSDGNFLCYLTFSKFLIFFR